MTGRGRWAAVATVVVVATACGGGAEQPNGAPSVSAGDGQSEVAVSEVPTAPQSEAAVSTPSETAPAPSSSETGGQVVIEEDFGGPTSWPVGDDEFARKSIENEQFVVTAHQKNITFFGGPELETLEGFEGMDLEQLGTELADVQVEADVELLSGKPLDTSYGVACRVQPNGAHYYFAISTDGFYAIQRIDDKAEEQEYLTEDDLTSDAITEGVNHISATCEGDELTLTVNDEELVSVTNDQYATGFPAVTLIGLGEGLSWGFDNYVVTTLTP